jgi:two-component system, OmpR family, phosphate regulon sensor histidine kinase PhoR
MLKGELDIDPGTARIMRWSSLIIPILFTVYSSTIQFTKIDSFKYPTEDWIVLAILIPWVIAGIIQFVFPIKKQSGAWLYLAANHLFAMLSLLFFASFSTSLSPLWVVLFLASHIYFPRTGVKFSIALLFLTAIVDTLMHFNSGTLATNAVIAFGVTALGITAIELGRVQEKNSLHSHIQEALQKDRILTIVNNLADAVLSTDKNGIIRVYNAACLNLLDTNSSLNGHHIDEILTLYGPDDKPIDMFKTLEKARSVVIRDDLTITIEGETLRLEVTYSPIRSSYSRSKKAQTQDGYIMILRDVTKAKSLEEERDEFISVVSHELRTPITITEGTISNVQVMMGRPGISETILRDGIDTAHEQILYLSKMVNDLSTLSRAERGVADTPEEIDVRNLVDDLYNEYEPQAKKRKLHFDLDLSSHLGHVTASRLYLKELLQNFITNALKYTKEGSITLEVQRKNDQITFTVKDTGIGISKSDQAKIFNKFYRSEDYRTRETSGTGLGLYVAAKLAKKIGTKIELSSRLNHGSSFSFKLVSKNKK